MNILTDTLEPKTIGECIDSLIIQNIRMWHEQEKIYEIETLSKMQLADMFKFLKESGWLNLMRNQMMEKVDLELEQRIVSGSPPAGPRKKGLTGLNNIPIWEE
jgi:hypothetical protein